MPSTEPERPETKPGSEPNVVRLLWAALFGAWHRVLKTLAAAVLNVAHAMTTVARRWAQQWVRARNYHAIADAPWVPDDARDRETAAAIGLRAFAVGVALAAWATADLGSGLVAGIVLAATELLWAGARFIIIAVMMPSGVIDRPRLSIAFFAGLVPYLFGTTSALRILSLVASAYLTWRGLQGAGVRRLDATRAIGWSFGGQAGVIATGWLLRALLALVVGV
jgi:hypothetical protein